MRTLRPSRLLIALALGLIVGLLLGRIGGAAERTVLAVAEPIGTLWVNAIRMTVVPLVVSLLVTGIAETANAARVGRLGARTLAVFVALLAVAAVFALLVVPPLFGLLRLSPESTAALRASVASSAAATTQELRALPSFSQWLTGLIPQNPVRAAADGAMLPLVIFTLAFALAILRLGDERRDAVVRFFGGVGDAMLVIVRWLIYIAPIGIFALAITPAARLGILIAGAIGYYVVAMIGALLVFTVVLVPIAVIAGRVPLERFVRAALPAQTVAFSSSSSLASLPALIDGAERGLGVAAETSGFVLPLAVATLKVVTPLSWAVGAMFIAILYGVPLSIAQIATVALTGAALSFSIPGVPNAAFLLITPLFVNLGLPPEGVGLLIAADAVPDLFATLANVSGDITACAIVARNEPRAVDAEA